MVSQICQATYIKKNEKCYKYNNKYLILLVNYTGK